MSKKVNLSGKRFGSLTAIEPIGKDVHGKTLWSCICDCGGKVIVPYGNLAYGNTKSCGCKKKKLCADSAEKTGGIMHRKKVDHNIGFIPYGCP